MLDSNSSGEASAPDLPPAQRLNNPLDGLLGYQLRRASAAVLADLGHALSDLSLTISEASVLQLIAANPDVTQSEIGRTLAIKRANMAPIAATLTARGWVERSRPDGRSQGLRLTGVGTDAAREVRRRIDAHETRFMAHLPACERDALIAMVRRVWQR